MHTISIQRRLIAAVVIAQLLLAIGLVALGVVVTRRQLRDAFDAGLNGRAMSVAALVRYSEEQHPRLIFESDLVPPPWQRDHPDLFEVTTQDGRVLARSPNWSDQVSQGAGLHETNTEFSLDGVRYRALRMQGIPVLDREGDEPSTDLLNVVYASPTAAMSEAVLRTAVEAALGGILLACITGMLAVWGLRRGLQPLSDLAKSAQSISTHNWDLRPSEAAQKTRELAPLVQAMTTMLQGLRQAFTQQSEFLANAAHELKTPVAILKSTLQSLLQRERAADEYRVGLEEALQDMARLEQLLHSMLRLARAEQGTAGTRRDDSEPVDLTATCKAAVERLQPLARERSVALKIESNGAIPALADAEDLALVWSNLLENAIRFSPADGMVQLRVRSSSDRAFVEVKDQGPGIPPEELPHLFERFHRGDNSRARNTGGYGLGLAISKALIEAYGGSIVPESEPGQGTRMIVSLPLASALGQRK